MRATIARLLAAASVPETGGRANLALAREGPAIQAA